MRTEVVLAVALVAIAVSSVAFVRAPRQLGPARSCAPAVMVGGTLRCGAAARAACDGALLPGDRTKACRVIERMAPDDLQRLAVPLDINAASAEDLTSLPRVGPVLAQRIVDARPFRAPEELLRVKGIGPKTWSGARNRVRIGFSRDSAIPIEDVVTTTTP